ncbi:hypothetical protein ACVK1X_000331 [Pseudomonas sp. PvR086]|jgi:hypothetical protein|nr:hypothetical protein [Pseudomonas frederiksbergensis]PZW61927.1 hypothetical protein F475_02773 [Pseudomonas sp. URMO17WK12:I6]
MPTLVLNPLIDIADLPGSAHGGEFVRAGFIVFKEFP